MSNYKFEKPAKPSAGVTDAQLLILGLSIQAEKTGKDTSLYDEFKQENGLMDFDVRQHSLEPFTAEKCLNVLDRASSNVGDNWLEAMPERSREILKQKFAELGMGSAFDDGVISTEELVMASAAKGQAALDQYPDKYQVNQNQVAHAAQFLKKHGIDDPDGDVARGLAANALRVAERANDGLGVANGIAPEAPTLHSTSTAEFTVYAPTPGL